MGTKKRVNPYVYSDRPSSYIIATLMVCGDLSVNDVAEAFCVNESTIRTKLYRNTWSMEDLVRFTDLYIKSSNDTSFQNYDISSWVDIYNNGGAILQ